MAIKIICFRASPIKIIYTQPKSIDRIIIDEFLSYKRKKLQVPSSAQVGAQLSAQVAIFWVCDQLCLIHGGVKAIDMSFDLPVKFSTLSVLGPMLSIAFQTISPF